MTEFIPGLPIEQAGLIMEMHSQETPLVVIDQERSIVAGELSLSEHVEIIFYDEGWDSRVYMINGGEIVYKFPRSPYVMQGYSREIATLRMLEDTTSSKVTTQRFRSLDPGNRYFSYRGVVGTQLSELMGSMEADEKQRIGTTVGLFLRELHALVLDGAPVVTADDEIKEYQTKYRLAMPVIESHFSTDEQLRIAKFFLDQMPAEIESLGSESRLCHGDLGSYNIVIGEDGTTGIIDFGNVGYYDQSKDFIDFGDDVVLLAALEAYGDSELLRAKVVVRTIALSVIDLVYYMSKKDNEGLMSTVERLRALLQSLPNDSSPGGSENHG
ncbi:MAG: aminoglycoside phosphotransferase family protein [bacterium]|nr:aminoglycoside phosphotransferase family protein [bacterium]